jgi:hypothetical protein
VVIFFFLIAHTYAKFIPEFTDIIRENPCFISG